ncbi:MAG: DUF3842 family protein, partial [Firmicutes bacterium]|nr:DUF3842 family protein [Bacillota bacterium]
DGQGGRLGKLLIERLKIAELDESIIAVGTNSMATAAMIKAGAPQAATGENAVIVNSRRAGIIVGPLGIVCADALLGEVTPAMATAIGQSDAHKLLIPTNRCNHQVIGVDPTLTMNELVQQAVDQIIRLCSKK